MQQGQHHSPNFHLGDHSGLVLKRRFRKPEKGKAGTGRGVLSSRFLADDDNDIERSKMPGRGRFQGQMVDALRGQSQIFANNQGAITDAGFKQLLGNPGGRAMRIGEQRHLALLPYGPEPMRRLGQARPPVQAQDCYVLPGFPKGGKEGLHTRRIGEGEEPLFPETARQPPPNTKEERVSRRKNGNPLFFGVLFHKLEEVLKRPFQQDSSSFEARKRFEMPLPSCEDFGPLQPAPDLSPKVLSTLS